MKLYTKTVCPKCILVKSMINASGVPCEVVNIDENEVAKQELIDEGIMAVPVLLVNGVYLTSVPDINKAVAEAHK